MPHKIVTIWTAPKSVFRKFFELKRLDDGSFRASAKANCFGSCCICNNPDPIIFDVVDNHIFLYCSPQCKNYFGIAPSAKELLKVVPYRGRLISLRILGRSWTFNRS